MHEDEDHSRQWVVEGVLPDWNDIHHNVLTQARMDAARLVESAESNSVFGDDDRFASHPMSKTEFMRRAGFDERFIVMLTSWVEEQQQVVNTMANIYLNEVQDSISALVEAQSHTETESLSESE